MNGTVCTLEAAERAEQLERYRALARHAAEVEHAPARVIIRFLKDPPTDLLERTLDVERGCCPFFDIEYEPVGRRLVIAVEDPDHDRDLDAIAHALRQSGTTGSLAVGHEPTSRGHPRHGLLQLGRARDVLRATGQGGLLRPRHRRAAVALRLPVILDAAPTPIHRWHQRG